MQSDDVQPLPPPPRLVPGELVDTLHALTAKVQSGTVRLSQCLAEGAGLGSRLNSQPLLDFCSREIQPYLPQDGDKGWPSWRWIDVYAVPVVATLVDPGVPTEQECLEILKRQLGVRDTIETIWNLPIGETENLISHSDERVRLGRGYSLTVAQMPPQLFSNVPDGYTGTVTVIVPSNSLRTVIGKTRAEFTRRLLELDRTLLSVREEAPKSRAKAAVMSKLFMSHSSKDKPFAEKLSKDLEAVGHLVWLDKTAIKVGDSIPEKIAEGLKECEFVVVVLSTHSVESKWVENEWHAKYWKQVTEGKKFILPVMLHECAVPTFLEHRKYANFKGEYDDGLTELLDAITPIDSPATASPKLSHPKHVDVLTALLSKVHDKSKSVSELLVEALSFAAITRNTELAAFCKQELETTYPPADEGEREKQRKARRWRLIECYASTKKVNANYMGFSTESGLFDFITSRPDDFPPQNLFENRGVAEVELWASQAGNTERATGLIYSHKHKDLFPDSTTPDVPVYVYMRTQVYARMLVEIRQQLTSQLIALLPSISA